MAVGRSRLFEHEKFLTGNGIPKPNRSVVASRCQTNAVRGKSQRPNFLGIATSPEIGFSFNGTNVLDVVNVPENDRPITCSRRQSRPVGRERHGPNLSRFAEEHGEWPAALRGPQLDASVLSARGDE